MVRAWLTDDVDPHGDWAARPSTMDPVTVSLEDDPWPCDATEPPPDFPTDPTTLPPSEPPHAYALRQRARTGYDADGNPEYSWTDVAVGEAVIYEERAEYDDEVGTTIVTARLVLFHEGTELIDEAAVVVRDDDVRYNVTSAVQSGSTLTMRMNRIETTGD